MGMRDRFGVSPKLATEGIWRDFGDFRIRIARAGEGNAEYKKAAEAMQRNHQRALANNLLSDEKAVGLMHGIYADTIVKEWQTAVPEDFAGAKVKDEDGERFWTDGIEGKGEGEVIPASRENIIATFKEFPDVFLDIKASAETIAYYRSSLLKEAAGN